MAYYIGLEVNKTHLKLINVKKVKENYIVTRKVNVPLEQDIMDQGTIQDFERFSKQLQKILEDEKIKGTKIGVLIGTDEVIRRTVYVPYFIRKHIKTYLEINWQELFSFHTEHYTYTYEPYKSEARRNKEIVYQILAVPKQKLMNLTRTLEDLGLHTLCITTMPDTIQQAMPICQHLSYYCVLLQSNKDWIIAFYNGIRCISTHSLKNFEGSIEPMNEQEAGYERWAWDIFRMLHSSSVYSEADRIEKVFIVWEDVRDVEAECYLSSLLDREVEEVSKVRCHFWGVDHEIQYAGLVGVISQMSKGEHYNESCTL